MSWALTIVVVSIAAGAQVYVLVLAIVAMLRDRERQEIKLLAASFSFLALFALATPHMPSAMAWVGLSDHLQVVIPVIWIFLIYSCLQREAQRKMELEQQRLQTVLRNMPVMLAALDQSGNVVAWNRRCEEVTGFTFSEMAAQARGLDLIYPDREYRETMFAEWEARGDDFENWEWDIRRKDGDVRRVAWSNISKRFIVPGWATWAIGVDVTEEKRVQQELVASERRLRASEERYRTLTETSTAGIWHIDAEGYTVYLNPAMARMLDIHGIADLEGKSFHEFFTPESLEIMKKEHARRAQGVSSTYEVEMVSAQGQYRHVLVSGAPYQDIGGGVRGLIGTFADVSLLKQAQEDLQSEKEFSYRTLNTLPGVFLLLDTDGNVLRWNQALEAATGFTSHELHEANVAQFLDDEGRNRVLEEIQNTLISGEEWAEYEIVHRDGSAIPYLFRAKHYRYRDQQCCLAIGVDIRAQREAERERHKLQEQLLQQQKIESLGMLAGGVAHDFNNLLTAILGYADIMLYTLSPEDENRERVAEIAGAAERAATLTRQLLAFGRRQDVRLADIDLGATVANMKNMLQRLIGEDIKLTCSCDLDIPTIKADTGQIEQIVMNLAVNARDAMPRGGSLTITAKWAGALPPALDLVETEAADGYVCLTVRDTGTGMDAKTQKRIFEPFFTTKGRHSGTGLGLSTVFGIVKQFRGEITVESSPGKGSVFFIYFPASAHGVSLAETREPHDTNEAQQAEGSERILLVEDDPAPRALVTEVLRRQGYDVLIASSVAEGIEQFRTCQGRIDAVVCDVILPDGTGRDVVTAIQRERPDTKILLMSGYTGQKLQTADIDASIPFLHKPFAPAVLIKTLRDILDGAAASSSLPARPSFPQS